MSTFDSIVLGEYKTTATEFSNLINTSSISLSQGLCHISTDGYYSHFVFTCSLTTLFWGQSGFTFTAPGVTQNIISYIGFVTAQLKVTNTLLKASASDSVVFKTSLSTPDAFSVLLGTDIPGLYFVTVEVYFRCN